MGLQPKLIMYGGVTLAIIGALTMIYIAGGNARENKIKAQVAVETLKRINAMEDNNAAFKALTPYGKCIAYAADQHFDRGLCDEFK